MTAQADTFRRAESSPYVVAEINTGHFGNWDRAIEAIHLAARIGCKCIKFQSFQPDSLYAKSYLRDHKIEQRMYSKFALSFNQIRELAIEAHSQGIGFSSTVYSLEEAIQLSSVSNLAFIKVASMDIDNLGLLNEVCRLGLPVVLSSGMASMNELERAVETCLNTGNQKLALLHCVSLYPTMTEDLNLLNIVQLRGTFPGIEIGLSDHSSGVLAGAVAVALGVRLIEKHLTLDKSTPGFDNSMALDGDQMSSYVANCVEAWKSLGGRDRNVSPSELDQRKKMRRSCVYSRDLKAGEVLLGDFIEFRRPGVGIPIVASHGLIGRVLQVDVLEGDLISEDNFD